MTSCQDKEIRLVLLACKAGGGHVAAARALKQALKKYPDCSAKILYIEDIIGTFGKSIGTLYGSIYNFALARGWYHLEPFIFRGMTFTTRCLQSFAYDKIKACIEKENPQAWISLIHGVHPLLDKAFEDDACQRITVITDMVTIRSSWINIQDDLIFVSTDAAYEACLLAGAKPGQIRQFGHPISPDFFALQSQVKGELNFGFSVSVVPLVMLMSGGVGSADLLKWCRYLAKSDIDVQIVVCCGNNARLFKRLKAWAVSQSKVFYILGYTEHIPQWMHKADVVVTKPGPGVIMEAIAAKCPILIDATRYTMFQEKGNADYVSNHQLGSVMYRPKDFISLLSELLFDQDRKAVMKLAFSRYSKANASLRIADQVHQLLIDRSVCRD